MKKLFLWMLAYYWLIAVGVQLAAYFFTGQFEHGYGMGIYTCPDKYYLSAAGLLSIVVFLGIFFIWISPKGKGRLQPVIEWDSAWYYYVVVIFLIVSRLIVVGSANGDTFSTVISGAYNGTFYAYLKFFFDLQTVFLITLLCQKSKVSLWMSCGLYIAYTMLIQSRAGFLFVFIILMSIIFSSDKIRQYGQKIKFGIMFVIIFAPVSYVIVTTSRGHNYGGTIDGIIKKIVNRCSRLELAGIPLFEMDRQIYNKEIFYEKYSFIRQIQLSINSLLPGDIFPADVQPNQYYRSTFLGLPEITAKKNYTSINITFPSYLTLKYGMLVAIVISVAVIVGLYYLSLRLEDYTISRIIPVMILMDVLDFFDWAYIMQRVFVIFCTIFFFWLVRFVTKKIKFRGFIKIRFRRYGELDETR